MREDAQPRRWARVRRILVPTLVATGVLAGAWVAARAWFDTRDELDRTATVVRETRSELATARDDLAVAIAHLEAERAAMHRGLATLDTRERERDAAEGTLAATKSRLAAARAELAAATADLAQREGRLQGLERCVRGVVEGLNQAAVGDIAGVDATLAEIEGTCESAGANL
jgi:chromosome segregation ATPase